MIIQCSNCKAKFKIADSKTKKEEFKARCAKCEQIFIAKIGVNIFPDLPSPEQPKDEPKKTVIEDVKKESDLFKSSLFDTEELSVEEPKVSPREPQVKAEKSVEQLLAEEFPEGDTADIPKETDSGEAKREELPLGSKSSKAAAPQFKTARITAQKPDSIGSKLAVFLYASVIVVSFLGGFVYAGLSFPFKDLPLLFAKNPEAISKGLTFTDVGSEFVDTALGEVFVISGTMFNNSSKPLAGAEISGELYSSRNLFLKKEKFPCCSLFEKKLLHELRDFGSLDLMYKKDAVGKISPYKSMPFMLVFKRTEDPIKSFRINVLND